MKKICIVTGTRAEYGLLKPVIEKLYHSEEAALQPVVTGTHLSEEFGSTWKEIEEDGYPIAARIPMPLDSDTPAGITRSMGVVLSGFAEYFQQDRPKLVAVLGDRYEMLMVACAALMAGIPIAHIHGGEITEGAYDDAIRHCITKMSHLHFPSTAEYRNRIIQLGENPETVYNVGALGVENIKKLSLWTRERLEEDLGFSFSDQLVLVTYHPTTLEAMDSRQQFENLLRVIDQNPKLQVIFTKANADTDGKIINRMIDEYVDKNRARCHAFASLGQIRYLSTLQFCRAVVGNSSSGIIEVPSFHIPTVNIGDRQKGRIAAESVIHCGYETEEIKTALEKAFSVEFRQRAKKALNPYEGEDTSQRIVERLLEAAEKGIERKKHFYDILTR